MNSELRDLPIRNDLVAHLDNRVRELGVKLERYRRDYNQLANRAAEKLKLEIGKTVEGNTLS